MRTNPAIPAAVILMLTSADRSGDARRCREMGLSAYLIKPITQKELRASLIAALSGVQARATAITPRVQTSRGPLRILLAEDNLVNQKVAVTLLAKLGHTVRVVDDGRAAVDAFKREAFDVILMDVQMPEMSGLEATAAIRQIEAGSGARIPIIAMTARAMKQDRDECLRAGMDEYLVKARPESATDRAAAASFNRLPRLSVRQARSPPRSTGRQRSTGQGVTRCCSPR